MEGFCGEPFWTPLTSTTGDISECFQQSALVYLPCAFLWFASVYECIRTKSCSKLSIHCNFPTVCKSLLRLLLPVLSAVEFSLAIHDVLAGFTVYPVQYITPIVKLFTYCLALVLILCHRSKGIHITLFLFWMFLTVYAFSNNPLIFSNRWNADLLVKIKRSYIFKAIEFPLILVQLFLAFFVDARSHTVSSEQKNAKTCPREWASFPSQLIFQWVTPLIRLGYKQPLQLSDLWSLDRIYTSDYVLGQFEKHWNRKSTSKGRIKQNVALVIFLTFWPFFFWLVLLKVITIVLMFLSPTVLDWLISFLRTNEANWKGYLYAGLLFLISLLNLLFSSYYEYVLGVLQMKVKICLSSIIFKKALVLSNDGRKDCGFSTGQIINMMSVDVQILVDFINKFQNLWNSPIQLVICFTLIWQQLGIATLAGAAALLLLVPVNMLCSRRLKKIQSKVLKQKDKRSKLLDEILNGIKIIKLYSWENPFKAKVNRVRNKELEQLNKATCYWVGVTFAFSCTTFFVTLASFSTFLMIDQNNILTVNRVFVSLTLLNMLNIPFGYLPLSIISGAIARVSLQRLGKYLNADELEGEELTGSYNSKASKEGIENGNRNAIKIKDGSFSWNKNGDVCLKDIDLEVEKCSLVAVVGKVGCGKSSLANALIGELKKQSGSVEINGSISYVPQISWILNNTLRENIVFMNSFDQEHYDKVLQICALDDDLKVLPNGDLTEIGERGINLSGGQKQRVSLARACYSNADIFVLDDPLSAVDAHVGKHIFDKVIGPQGYLKNKTRILITHKIPLLTEVDRIIVLKDGRISEQGSYDELIEAKGEFSEILNTNIDAEEVKEECLEKSIGSSGKEVKQSKVGSTAKDKNGGKLITEEKQAVGSTNLQIYRQFFQSIGYWYIFFALLSFSLSSSFNVATNFWLTAWSDDADDPAKARSTAQRNMRIGVYAAFGLANGIFKLLASTLVNLGMIRAGKHLFVHMFDSILRAPMLFFDTTPTGRTLNRFKDLDSVDLSLRIKLRLLLVKLFKTIGTIVIFWIETPIFLVVSIPIGLLFIYIQKLYIATSRQLKRLESTTRSPIYSHFSETVQGVSSIRAYGLTEKFIKECHRRIDLNNTCSYPSVATTGWLIVRLGFLGQTVVLLTAVFAVLYRESLSPSMAGLATSFSLSFTGLLNSLINAYSEVETNIVAVERCCEYTRLESEAPAKSEYRPPLGWPSKGVVKFKNYGTRYRKGLIPVLKNLTFETRENEKIGICGRTGAGKSTMTLAMFRLLEPSEGTIEIDGVDIRSLGLDDLRSNLTIIPQDPFLYSDTLRMNLDPLNKYADEELWKALEQASLKEFVQQSPEGLNKIVEEGGSNLSVGQRQLVCLARALLRRTKVLILDEATAACDFETDEVIQKTIRSAFANCTILTIAHRLNTIIDYDKVIVLENGELREYDSPQKLLEDKSSIFYSMAKESSLVWNPDSGWIRACSAKNY